MEFLIVENWKPRNMERHFEEKLVQLIDNG